MKLRIRRPWLSAVLGSPLLAIAILFASLEWSAVPREKCNWGTDQLCTDYKGFYGLLALGITIVLIIALLVINRDRSGYR